MSEQNGFPAGSRTTLQTKSVNNIVQSLLNLVQGSNVTLTDNGDGSVTIAASGGGSGTVTAVTGTAPITSSGGATPAIGIGVASSSVFGAVKVDGTTITAAAGVISAVGGGSGYAGPTTQAVVTGSRVLGTVYQNTSGKPMWINITFTAVAGTDGINIVTDASSTPTVVVASLYNFSNATAITVSFLVLTGNYYEVVISFGSAFTIDSWVEWT